MRQRTDRPNNGQIVMSPTYERVAIVYSLLRFCLHQVVCFTNRFKASFLDELRLPPASIFGTTVNWLFIFFHYRVYSFEMESPLQSTDVIVLWCRYSLSFEV